MTDNKRTRLDEALVVRGLAQSRSRARDMIKRGAVALGGATETRPARMIAADTPITIDDPAARYVSRAALKLVAGLNAFGFDPAGLTVLDLGASTGGFTQVLLERGAAHVIAIEVGHDEMDATLAADPRVTLIEGLNARDLTRAQLGERHVEAIVADLSFISLKLALPPALSLAEPDAWGVFLVKPQFEVGRAAIGKDGVVKDADTARAAANDIAGWLEGGGDDLTSPLRGSRSLQSEARQAPGGGLEPSEPLPPSETSYAPLAGFDLPSGGRLRDVNATPDSSTRAAHRWRVTGLVPCPIAGGSGNTEFLLGARRD